MEDQANNIGIDFLSVFGMPPADFVHMAADLGCGHVSLGLTPFRENPHNYPRWSLLENAALQRAVKQALCDRGIRLAIGEGVMLMPGADIEDSRAQIAALCALGAERINVVPLERDRGRCFDQLARFAEIAAAEGGAPVLEFAPIFGVPDIAAAADAVAHSGRSDFRIVLDTLHFIRSGGEVSALAQLDPALIGYVQLCDGPAAATHEQYMDECKQERLAPGDGAFPLQAIVAALPRNLLFGLETPMHAAALGGIGPAERLGRCVAAARRLLAAA